MGARAFRSFLAALLLLFLSGAGKASALPDRVLLTVVGTARDLELVRSALAVDAFQDVTPEWVLQPRWDARELVNRGLPESVAVACWIDLSEPERAELYFAHRARARFLLREVPLGGGLDELGRETLAQVLEMSVRALQEDEYAGISRDEAARALDDRALPESSEPLPASASPRRAEVPSGQGLSLAPFYAVRSYSSDVLLVHGPGVAFGWAGSSPRLRARVWATAQYELPRSLSTASVGLDWSTVLLRAVFALDRQLGDVFELGARAGLGVNVVRIEPTRGRGDGAVVLASRRAAAELVFELGLEGCAELAPHVAACARLFTDVHPERMHYGLEGANGMTTVFEPWMFRPGMALSLLLQ